ncbi:hypothetical protein PInf_009788 [Phytophthora infestans]|nr:hypothetical protein PInf_009788 [Phytophthora infestans]
MEEAIRIALQKEYSHKQARTPQEEKHRHDEDGAPREAEHRSNDAVAPAVKQPVDTGAHSEPEPMDLRSAESLSSEGRQPVDSKSGGLGHGQVDEDSPATGRGGMPY